MICAGYADNLSYDSSCRTPEKIHTTKLQKDGCPKCYFALQNYQTYKVAVGLFEHHWASICEKRINFGAVAISVDFDTSSMD
ncbi:Hypothetical predicted protein [Cloeon dipterum]|uniref:Uncharacterized protein n=1 Tax=Cloeon dipterum TaxID=197152 RepID=A0A8S1DJJ3_9INSE|nr:Hypothetical predicted protein [Cloeon dipterum]